MTTIFHMMNPDSTLLGDDEPVKYSTESSDGDRMVYVTPSKIITENNGSEKGRAILLSKVTFMKKKPINTDAPLHYSLRNTVLFLLSLFFGFSALYALTQSSPFSMLLLTSLLCVGFFGWWMKSLHTISNTDWGPEDDVVWFNAQTNQGGVGFRIKESEIPKIVQAMDEGLVQEVEVVNG
jgi:hypothetical protein